MIKFLFVKTEPIALFSGTLQPILVGALALSEINVTLQSFNRGPDEISPKPQSHINIVVRKEFPETWIWDEFDYFRCAKSKI